MTFKEALLQDFWFHLGGLISIGIGVFSWYQSNHMGGDPSSFQVIFVVGGLAAMGVKILNGSTSMLRTAVGIAKSQPAVISPADPKQTAA